MQSLEMHQFFCLQSYNDEWLLRHLIDHLNGVVQFIRKPCLKHCNSDLLSDKQCNFMAHKSLLLTQDIAKTQFASEFFSFSNALQTLEKN